ncbi:MAG: polysaccharide deacetylase family protein [Desulfotignum sp.]|nr:polysaccharide deacetylase family protein [Desulfotignum sp.]MCF8135832.1 polysaccharide deacetylase family protein [Desulfotignum sp.]
MNKMIAANFHYIKKDFSTPYPSIFGRTPEQFRHQLESLASIGTFISQDEIKDHLVYGKRIPEKAFLITFDDGLKEQYELAVPILKQMGIPALFFVNTLPLKKPYILNVHKIHLIRSVRPTQELNALLKKTLATDRVTVSQEQLSNCAAATYRYDQKDQRELKYLLNFLLTVDQREKYTNDLFNQIFQNQEAAIHKDLYMTSEQIKHLHRDGMLGCHGHRHHPLGRLDAQSCIADVTISKTYLENLAGGKVYAFCYPYGTYDAVNGADTIVRNTGFLFAFTMERAVNDNYRLPFLFSRFDTNDLPGGKLFNQNPATLFDDLPFRKWMTPLIRKREL